MEIGMKSGVDMWGTVKISNIIRLQMKERKERKQIRWVKSKTNSKMLCVTPIVLLSILNVNGLKYQ